MPSDSLLTPLEFHVLVALARGEAYGYALMTAVEEESSGRVAPDVGSLYRVLARLMARGLVEERPTPEDAEQDHPGKARRYYGLTVEGRDTAADEARRMAELVDLAQSRRLFAAGDSS